MSKPGADPASGISLGEVLILSRWHPAYRRRESQSGSCTERENLHGDAKGKGASGYNHEAKSTDAPVRHAAPRGVVMSLPTLGDERHCCLTSFHTRPVGPSNKQDNAAAVCRLSGMTGANEIRAFTPR
jgi:hypothetical protein